MATSQTYLEYLLDRLSGLEGISARKMMGEYMLYSHGKIAALVCDNRLLVKPVPAARKCLPDAPMEPPYPGAKEMLLVEETDDAALLTRLFREMEPELPEPKKKEKKNKGEKTMLEAGKKAPDFTLLDQKGNTVRLSDFLGRKVVLYFYPKDNTPGCTRQACAFAAGYGQFRELDVAVIGISKDSVASHVKFAQKYDLPFVLLSDPELQAIQAYGVWQEKKLYGKVSMGVVRTTFLIDEQGNIEKVMPKVKPDTNAAEILAYLSGEKR